MIVARSMLTVMAAAFAVVASAQSFPAKPIHMFVGYSAGGGADALARIVAQKWSTELGQ